MHLFQNDFEFFFVTDSNLHEHKLRLEISLFLNDEITKKKIDVKDKHELMNKYLKMVEDTPMIMFSKKDDHDKEGGYFYERNKILIPNHSMLQF